MKTMLQILLLVVLLAVACVGCSVGQKSDGSYGVTIGGMSEEQHEEIAQTIEGAGEAVGGLSSLFPALLPIATALGVGGATWRKMKGTVTKNKEPLKMLVEVLEHVKANDAEVWAKVKAEIKAQYPSLDIRGTIEEVKAELVKQGRLATGTRSVS